MQLRCVGFFWVWVLLTGCVTELDPQEGCEVEGCAVTQACNPLTHQCEDLPACENHSDCGELGRCLDQVCSSCETNIQCTAALTSCNPDTQGCTTCRGEESCGGAFPLCGLDGCVACLDDEPCGGARPRCAYGSCVECASPDECPGGYCAGGLCRTQTCDLDDECAAPTPFCHSRTFCAECVSSRDCPGDLTCDVGACRPALPGDTCKNPIVLQLASGSSLVEAKGGFGYQLNRGATSFYSSTQDLYYSVTVTEEQALNVEVTSLEFTDMDAKYVSILSGDPCDPYVLATGGSNLLDVFVVPGTYVIRVQSGDYTLRRIRLKVYTTEASRAEGNHCLKVKPLPIAPTGGGEWTFTADLTGMHSLPDRTCDWRDEYPDLVYSFTLDEQSGVRVTSTPQDPALGVRLQLGGTCAGGSTNCPYVAVGAPHTVEGALPAGSHLLHVRGFAGEGATELGFKVFPFASNASCATAEPLVFVDGVATVSGHPRYADPSIAWCWGSEGQALHYALSTVGMGPTSLSFDLHDRDRIPELTLTMGCQAAGERADLCVVDDDLREFPYVPEGVYNLAVPWHDEFTLDIRMGPGYPPPPNDTCETAQTLALSANTFSGSGDTRGASDSLSNRSCDGSSYQPAARDVMFQIPVPGPGRLAATVTPTTPTFDPRVFINTSCLEGWGGDCADTAPVGAPETVSMKLQQPKAYLGVDGWAGTAGAFTIEGTFTPAPANDACELAEPLQADQPITASFDASFHRSARCYAAELDGPNLFYRFTAPSNGTATFTLTPVGFDGALALMSSCSSELGTTCYRIENSGLVGEAETWALAVSRNTTYIVGVYSTYGSEGTFTLSVAGP